MLLNNLFKWGCTAKWPSCFTANKFYSRHSVCTERIKNSLFPLGLSGSHVSSNTLSSETHKHKFLKTRSSSENSTLENWKFTIIVNLFSYVFIYWFILANTYISSTSSPYWMSWFSQQIVLSSPSFPLFLSVSTSPYLYQSMHKSYPYVKIYVLLLEAFAHLAGIHHQIDNWLWLGLLS